MSKENGFINQNSKTYIKSNLVHVYVSYNIAKNKPYPGRYYIESNY